MVQIFVANSVNELQIEVNNFLQAKYKRRAIHTSLVTFSNSDASYTEYVLSLTYEDQ